MKHWLFIYREDREACCDPDYGYINRLVMVEKEFSAGTPDGDILKLARGHEVKDFNEDHSTASEGILNRTLLRVIQVSREIQF